jgi:mono/diheme cytochrome c family protein
LAVGALVIGGVAVSVSKISTDPTTPNTDITVQVPSELSLTAQKGQAAFNANCAKCHGQNAGGTDQGPPFVHNIYNPGHHGDEAFFVAAKLGVRAHHWSFGNMPPQPQVNASDVAAIVAYVRELQAANGIVTRPHQM